MIMRKLSTRKCIVLLTTMFATILICYIRVMHRQVLLNAKAIDLIARGNINNTDKFTEIKDDKAIMSDRPEAPLYPPQNISIIIKIEWWKSYIRHYESLIDTNIQYRKTVLMELEVLPDKYTMNLLNSLDSDLEHLQYYLTISKDALNNLYYDKRTMNENIKHSKMH